MVNLTTPANSKAGWVAASWIVAHAWRYHIHQVSFAGWMWTPEAGRWTRESSSGSAVVTYS